MTPRLNLTGHRFGRLSVLDYTGSIQQGRGCVWRCRCDCGSVVEVASGNLRNGDNRSCGCLQKERRAAARLVHGHARKGRVTPERHIWSAMRERCSNPNNRSFAKYGGRGISVCDEWQRYFSAFLRDMGPRPSPQHSIERLDNDKGYEPSNCCWATKREQGRNKRTNRMLEHDGERKALASWAEEAGIPARTLWRRLQLGWPIARALHQPIQHHKA